MFQIKVVHLFKIHINVFLYFLRKINPLAVKRCRRLAQVYIYSYCFIVNLLQRFTAKGLIFRKKHKNTFSCILKRGTTFI